MDQYANDSTPIGTPPDNTSSWYQFAQRPYDDGGLGLAPHQAAGVVGNLMQESGGGIPSWGPTGDNGTAWGAAQWRGDRFNGLKQFAKDNGLDYKSTEAQQGWMRHELTTTHSDAYDALRAATSPEDAATAFNRKYEISADRTGGREATARAIFGGKPIPKAGGPGALAYTDDDNDDDTPTRPAQPALAPGIGALSKGQWKQLFSGEPADPWSGFGSSLAGVGAALAGIASPAQGQALNALSKQISDDGRSKFKTTIGKDGTVYRIDDQGNVMTAIGSGGGVPKSKYQEATINGVKTPGKWDGQNWTPLNVGQAQQNNAQPTTEDELRAISPQRADAAKDVFEGRVKLPAGSRLQPKQQQLRDDVLSVYKNIDETKLNARNAYMSDNAKSAPQSLGGQLETADTAMDQLDALLGHYEAMGNISTKDTAAPFFQAQSAKAQNAIYNSIHSGDKQYHVDQIGTLAKNTAADINKLQVAGRGTGSEREETEAGLNAPNDAPDIQAGKVQGHISSLRASIEARIEHERQNLGADFVKNDPRMQRYRDKLDALSARTDRLYASGRGTAPSTASAPSGGLLNWGDAQKQGWN
jgi:hypothetical protein